MRHKRFASIIGMAALAVAVLIGPTYAGLEDILYESGKISKEEWLKAKADKEKEDVEREKQMKEAQRGVVTHNQKKAKWVDSVTWSGDLRLRHEQFWRDQPAPAVGLGADRSRQRFRIRLGPEIKIKDFKIGIRLASGTGEQVSTNQSLDNAFSQKEIWIDRAFAAWNPSFYKPMTLVGGKMKNPFYTQYTNDVLFDGDVNPEGLAETFRWKLTDSIGLFTNFGQFALDEDSGDNNDQYMLAFQAGTEIKMGQSKARLAAGFFDALNLDAGGISEVALQQFNSRTAAAPGAGTSYVNDYDVLQLTGAIDTQMFGVPVNVAGDYVKNTTGVISCVNNAGNAPGRCGGTRIEGQDEGYQVGLRIGKASKANTWEVAYYYKWLQADAVLSAFADSDFGDGGTNRRGNIVWVGYNFTDFLNFKVKFFNTKPLEANLCGTNSSCRDNIDRMQIDMAFKF